MLTQKSVFTYFMILRKELRKELKKYFIKNKFMHSENIDQKIRLFKKKVLKIKVMLFLMRLINYIPILTMILAVIFYSFAWILYLITVVIIFTSWKLRAKLTPLQHRKNIYELTLIAYRLENGEKFKPGTKEKEKLNQLGEILRKD